MKPDDSAPGMLVAAIHRARHTAVGAELTARGLQDLGSPMILFGIRHRGQEGEVAAQRELADVLRISPASIAVSLKSLARAGYIEKRENSKDARRKRIAITPRGEEALETCLSVFQAVDARMFSGFSPEECAAIAQYHRRMLDNLRREYPDPDAGCEGGRRTV